MNPTTSLDWNAKLVRFFLNNPRLVWLLIFTFLVGGIVSLSSMRREGFPQISANVITVQTIYPGAGANEVEQQVTKEIESALKDSKGLKDLTSTSQNSFSNVIASFDESLTTEQAIQDVQNKVQGIRAQLPQDAETPKVSTFATGGPDFVLGVSSARLEDALRDGQQLSTVLSGVSGIKEAKLAMELPNRIAIRYRLSDLTSHGVNLITLSQTIQASNATIPAGTTTIGGKNQTIITKGTLTSPDDLSNLIVGNNPTTHQPVYLKDVASIGRELVSDQNIERFAYQEDGKLVTKPGVLLTVSITKDADVIRIKQALLDEISKKKAGGDLNKNLKVTFLVDQAKSTETQVKEIVEAGLGSKRNLYLLGGLQLLFLAMLLFVNYRAALVATLSVPLSIGFTLLVLRLLNIQLNTIVLFSFVLVLGLIVDPAVVMIEAIQRYYELRYRPDEAITQSGRRYGAALFIAVLTSLIVFIPFGVVSGIFGQIIKYIPVTVIPALIASYFVPMALLPPILKYLLGQPESTPRTIQEHEELPGFASSVMNLNAWLLQKTWRQVTLLLLTFILVVGSLSIIATGKVHQVQFSTPQDNQEINLSVTYARGITEEQKEATSRAIEQAVAGEAAVKQFFYFQQSPNGFSLMIELKDKNERPAARDKSKPVVKRLTDQLNSIPNLFDAYVAESSVGTPQSEYQVQTQLQAQDTAILERAAKDVGAFLKKMPEVGKVDDGFSNRSEPQLQVVLDRAKVQQAGLSNAEAGQQLHSMIDEVKAGRLEKDDNTEDIFLINTTKPTTLGEMEQLSLTSHTGTAIKLGSIASITQSTSPDAIQRSNGSRYVTVRARLKDSTKAGMVQNKLNRYLSPARLKVFSLESFSNKGEFEDIAKSFTELGVALMIAVLLTYIVLVLQFKSFSQPIIMMFTIPLSLIGVFPALWLTHSDLGFLELLGVTILVGIVENVAIFLIDYANQLMREQGLSAKVAIIQASGVRLRPILLTKIVTLASMLPLAIESDFWRGLAVVIIAGIGLSGFFSLVVIPILYVWLDSLRQRIHRAPRFDS